MANYIQNGNEQKEKLNDAKTLINEAIANYNSCLNCLAEIKGVEECEQLKIDIQNKISSLNGKITDIETSKTNITNKASALKREQDQKRAREEELKNQETKTQQNRNLNGGRDVLR